MRYGKRKLSKLWIHLTPLLVAALFLITSAVGQAETTTNVGGPIFSSTTWTLANSPYLATNSVQVMAGATLTIEPGVTVRFDAGKALSINGGLVAQGTEASPITFTANTTNPTPGFWGYIKFENSSEDATFDGDGNYTGGSIIQHAVVEYTGSDSSNSAALYLDQASPLIDQNVVRYNERSGIYLGDSSAIVSDNRVENNGSYGIRLSSSSAIVRGNWVENSGDKGIYASSAAAQILSNTVVTSGGDGIGAHGSGSPNGNVVVEGNTVRGAVGDGIDCYYATVRFNQVYANEGVGISSAASDVLNNVVAYNGGTGIEGSNYSTSIFSHNKVAHNAMNSPYSNAAGIYSGQASITYNSVVFNGVDANTPGIVMRYAPQSGACRLQHCGRSGGDQQRRYRRHVFVSRHHRLSGAEQQPIRQPGLRALQWQCRPTASWRRIIGGVRQTGRPSTARSTTSLTTALWL